MKLKGSKSKKCTLPSDYLTKKQKRELNGECKTWQMNEFYSYKEFKAMPDDIQEAYLSTLVQKYEVSLRDISEQVLGANCNTLWRYINNKNYKKLIKFPRRSSKDGHNKLIADKILKDQDIQCIPTPVYDDYSPFPEKEDISQIQFSISGFNHERIEDILKMAFGDIRKVDLVIIANKKKE